MSKIINLTPHNITIVLGDAEIFIAASGQQVRAKQESRICGDVDINGKSVPVTVDTFGEVQIPEGIDMADDNIKLISSLAAIALKIVV